MRYSLLLLLALSACFGGGNPATVYTLNTETETAPHACAVRDGLQVITPEAAPGLDSKRIAVMEGDRLNYYKDVRWADTPPAMIQDLLVDAFEKSKAFASVGTDDEPVTASLSLVTEIRDYEVADGRVKIKLVAKLVSGRRIISTIPVEENLEAGHIDEIITAFSDGTAKAIAEIVRKASGCRK